MLEGINEEVESKSVPGDREVGELGEARGGKLGALIEDMASRSECGVVGEIAVLLVSGEITECVADVKFRVVVTRVRGVEAPSGGDTFQWLGLEEVGGEGTRSWGPTQTQLVLEPMPDEIVAESRVACIVGNAVGVTVGLTTLPTVGFPIGISVGDRVGILIGVTSGDTAIVCE